MYFVYLGTNITYCNFMTCRTILLPTKCYFFYYFLLFDSFNINIFCKPNTKI